MKKEAQTPQLNIPDIIGSPILAKIEHMHDLGKSQWYELKTQYEAPKFELVQMFNRSTSAAILYSTC